MGGNEPWESTLGVKYSTLLGSQHSGSQMVNTLGLRILKAMDHIHGSQIVNTPWESTPGAKYSALPGSQHSGSQHSRTTDLGFWYPHTYPKDIIEDPLRKLSLGNHGSGGGHDSAPLLGHARDTKAGL